MADLGVSPACMPLATAAAVASTTMHFTPATALVGGLTLGIAAVAKYAITGRILGISGALKGFVQGNITPWRVWFTAGMVGGALVAQSITPTAFDILPSTFTVRSCCSSRSAPGSASATSGDTAGVRQQEVAACGPSLVTTAVAAQHLVSVQLFVCL